MNFVGPVRRSRLIRMSTLRSNGPIARPRVSSTSSRRESTRPRRSHRTCSRPSSASVTATRTPCGLRSSRRASARPSRFGLAAGGVTALAPAAPLTRKITENLDLGIEYGGALGSVGAISAPSQQAHIVYGVADIKLGAVDLDVGIGYGLTAASNGLALKLGIGHQY